MLALLEDVIDRAQHPRLGRATQGLSRACRLDRGRAHRTLRVHLVRLALHALALFLGREVARPSNGGDVLTVILAEPLQSDGDSNQTPRIDLAFLDEFRELGSHGNSEGPQASTEPEACQNLLSGLRLNRAGGAFMSELRPEEAVASVKELAWGRTPLVGVVLGSGLGRLVERLSDAVSIPYEAIPGMPPVGVPGHSGRLWLGQLEGVAVACLSGRCHLYEGYAPGRVTFGVRLLAALGCRAVLLTNAAGATTTRLLPGSLMLITDHINLTGQSPLVGWHHPARFLDMMGAYDPEFRELAQEVAQSRGICLDEGVYAGMLGPSYETPAEVRMLAILGADAVGMSTVQETLALRDTGVRVMGLSCITNAAAGVPGARLDHQHVQAVANAARERLEVLVSDWVACVAPRL